MTIFRNFEVLKDQRDIIGKKHKLMYSLITTLLVNVRSKNISIDRCKGIKNVNDGNTYIASFFISEMGYQLFF